jgi:hypothetical protein
VSALTHDFAADVAASKCYRGSILRPIVAAAKFAIFLIFQPFFAAAKLMFSSTPSLSIFFA